MDLDPIWQAHLWDPMTHCVRWVSLTPGNGRFGWSNRQLKHAVTSNVQKICFVIHQVAGSISDFTSTLYYVFVLICAAFWHNKWLFIVRITPPTLCKQCHTYLLTTRWVPGYLISYPVGYPGNELPDNGSPTNGWISWLIAWFTDWSPACGSGDVPV